MTQSPVSMAFEEHGVRIPVAKILPLKITSEAIKRSSKFQQIASSIREVGLVEPPVVARVRGRDNSYMLVDGHLRLEVLKGLGVKEVTCLVSLDDEAYSYNKRVNRLTIVQEHRMILEAVKRGVPEERLAKVLNVNVKSIRAKKHVLNGICSEVSKLLRDKRVPLNSFLQLKKMLPARQVEAAKLMIAMNKFSVPYAKSLVAATPQELLVERKKRKRGLSAAQVSLMEVEAENLNREFKKAERTFAADHLDLVLAKGYVAKLLGNDQVQRFLEKRYSGILEEFTNLVAHQEVARNAK